MASLRHKASALNRPYNPRLRSEAWPGAAWLDMASSTGQSSRHAGIPKLTVAFMTIGREVNWKPRDVSRNGSAAARRPLASFLRSSGEHNCAILRRSLRSPLSLGGNLEHSPWEVLANFLFPRKQSKKVSHQKTTKSSPFLSPEQATVSLGDTHKLPLPIDETKGSPTVHLRVMLFTMWPS